MSSSRPEPTRTLLRFAVIGSVDDGKSTLIGRLLYDTDSVPSDHLAALRGAAGAPRGESSDGSMPFDLAFLTDGLRAEREQGITIDVAYRSFSTARRRYLIADLPGHEQYTRNMVTGASTAQLAVLLVDAQVGWTKQSKRHAVLASLLGIPRLVIAVNKLDRSDDPERVFERLREEFAEFATKLTWTDLTFVPISALRGLVSIRVRASR